mmetsp:Transcript_39776/g.63803  ORF Transcript_39776/g.63803 Transcript_39776/m.63803 type:complete len:302 (-) Transcript_39776:254-1159(-)
MIRFHRVHSRRCIRERSAQFRRKFREDLENEKYRDLDNKGDSKTNMYPSLSDWAMDMLKALKRGDCRAKVAACRLICNEADIQLKRFGDATAPKLVIRLNNLLSTMSESEGLLRQIEHADRSYILKHFVEDDPAAVSAKLLRDRFGFGEGLLPFKNSSTKYAKKYVENASLRDLRNWCIHSRIKPFWNEAEQLLHGLMEFRGFSFNHQQQHLSQQSPELNKIVGDGITRSPDSRFSQVKDDIGYHLEERGGGDNRYEMIVQRILNYVPSYADVSKEMTAREKAGADWHQIPPYRRIQDIDE